MKDDKRKPVEILLLALLALLPFIMIYTIITFSGPQWDIMVRSLLGKTVINYFTHSVSAQNIFIGEYYNNLAFYFEPYREPVSILLFALLSLFFNSTIIPYLIIVYIIYITAFYSLSKELKINRLIAFTAFLNSYVAYFLFLPNGGEALSIIFVLVALVFLLKKRPITGAFLSLAVLSKYPAIALLPMILLLWDKKKVIKGIAYELLVLLPWAIFDQLMYGNPFYSYIESIANSGVVSSSYTINPLALLSILVYPIVIAIIAYAVLRIKKQKIKVKLNYNTKVFAAFIILAAIECIVIIPHNDPATQARYGYLLSISLLIPAAILLNRASEKMPNLKYCISVLAIILLIYIIYSAYSTGNTQKMAYYNTWSSNNIYYDAWSQLNALGYGNCRFISNAWVPMLYSRYDAYSPFIIYPSPTITPIVQNLVSSSGGNYTQYMEQEESYPIIAFKYIGVEESFIVNIDSSRLAYNNSSFSIYLPNNSTCYTDVIK